MNLHEARAELTHAPRLVSYKVLGYEAVAMVAAAGLMAVVASAI